MLFRVKVHNNIETNKNGTHIQKRTFPKRDKQQTFYSMANEWKNANTVAFSFVVADN